MVAFFSGSIVYWGQRSKSIVNVTLFGGKSIVKLNRSTFNSKRNGPRQSLYGKALLAITGLGPNTCHTRLNLLSLSLSLSLSLWLSLGGVRKGALY